MPCNFLPTASVRIASFWWLIVCLWLSAPASGSAQDFGFEFGRQSAPGQLVKLSAKLRPETGTQRAIVELTAVIAPRHHIYSTDQIKPGRPSVIRLVDSQSIRLLGAFVADKKPLVKDPDPDLGILTETFKDKVTWQAAVEFGPGVVVADQVVELSYSGLVCESTGSCTPIDSRKVKAELGEPVSEIEAKLIDESAPPIPASPPANATTAAEAPQVSVSQITEVPALGTETEVSDGFVSVTGRISHRGFRPGDSGSVFISADVIPGHHTYPNLPAKEKPSEPYLPTYMGVLSVAPGGSVSKFGFSAPIPSQAPHDHASPDGSFSVPALDGLVTWEIKFQVPTDLPPGNYRVTGTMQIQTCDEFNCQPPMSLAWQVPLVVGETTVAEAAPAVIKVISPMAQSLLTNATAADKFLASIGITASSSNVDSNPPSPIETVASSNNKVEAINNVEAGKVGAETGKPALDISQLKPDVKFDARTLSVPMVILVSLFGGFVLNFMPCVLPVIGLKILSLVEQAGESRVQALKFNGVYVLGMLAVFWILAALISFQQIAGWGSQFSSTLFNIVFSGVIFAMALSYLEVWEIVLPSAVGQHSAKLEQKEGLLGTFFKGGVTTILATPCSGPGLATALAWCADKEAGYVFLVFTCLGLGMGLPYLAVALYPPIISFLPKPGPWMLTFKQVMGFVLLGTVAFFLSYIELTYLFPTICFLMVIWFGCWLVGRLSFLSTTPTWLATWAMAILIIIGGSHVIYGWKISPDSSRWLANKGLPFDWNGTLANSWNLYDSQEYRMNTFVDRQIQERRTRPKEEIGNEKIDWKPFSLVDLQNRLHGPNPETILIDFTADWCANCKVAERVVLHSPDIERRLLSEHITTIIADKTHVEPEMDAMLKQLTGATAIPVYVIFAKDRPYEPIVLDGTTISIANVQAALDKAGVPPASEIKRPAADSADSQGSLADASPPLPSSQP